MKNETSCPHCEGEKHNFPQIIDYTFVGIGVVLFAIALIFDFSFLFELGLFLTSYFFIGYKVLFYAIKNISRGKIFDENFLMSIATIGAFAIQEFPEAVAVMLFYQIGEFFQEMAVAQSKKSISSLMDIRPDYANLLIKGEIKKVSPEEIEVGDLLLIKPGEKIPLDGQVTEGTSVLDTSSLTGESLPRDVSPGDDILSGSVNKSGRLTIKVTKKFRESTVSKILDLVENAKNKKSPSENFITKFAYYYTPIVVFAAIALAIIPPTILPNATFGEWINRALVFLVVSCPCALVISIPLSFFGGIGGASKNGILIKGSNYLEALNNVDTIVFDKTGTLTKGEFLVTDIVTKSNFSKNDLLKYAAFVESFSNHPISTSIVNEFQGSLDPSLIKQYQELPGLGIKAVIDEKIIIAGNDKLMKSENISFEQVDVIGTIIHLAIDNSYKGYIRISDEIRQDSKDAIQNLKNIGIKNLVMLTGDSQVVGNSVGKELGLTQVFGNLLPHEKVEIMETLSKKKTTKGNLIFVGDGINDAPVLARADIGIAMGGLGSDAAIEASDIVLMTDEPSKLVTAIKIARKTRRIVSQNIGVALSIKIIVLLLGALGFATLWAAVFADVGVALLAVLNAMRVLKTKNL